MDTEKEYDFEEVLNFTVEDLPDISVVKIRGWESLDVEKRDRCIKHLRDLVSQRDDSQSRPVDATELDRKLQQVSSQSPPVSPSPSFSTPSTASVNSAYVEEVRSGRLQAEKEACRDLIEEGGVPSHPVELGFDVFFNPQKYEDINDIVTYWGQDSPPGVEALGFVDQLNAWRKFRRFQQTLRKYFSRRGSFIEYQQKLQRRRQAHGLEGDVELQMDLNKQNKLANWMEYQDYQLQILENLEKKMKEIHDKLETAQKSLEDAGIPGFDGVSEPNFARIFSLNVQQGSVEFHAERRTKLAKRELGVAENRLRAAQSDHLGDQIDRSTWIRLAEEHLQYAKEQMDKIGDIQQYWGNELTKWFATEEEFIRAEETLKLARADDLGEIVLRPVLLVRISAEVLSAQARLSKAIKSEEQIELRGKVLGALSGLERTKTMLKRHNILLKWIEQQRQILVSEFTAGPDDLQEVADGRLRTLSSASKGSRSNRLLEASGSNGRQQALRSVLKVTQPSRVSKKRPATPARKKSAACNKQRAPEKATVKSHDGIVQTAPTTKDTTPPLLRAVHASRVSKAKRITRRAQSLIFEADSTGLSAARHQRNRQTPLSRTSTGRKLRDPSVSSQSRPGGLRRSTRISRKPEKFSPG